MENSDNISTFLKKNLFMGLDMSTIPYSYPKYYKSQHKDVS